MSGKIKEQNSNSSNNNFYYSVRAVKDKNSQRFTSQRECGWQIQNEAPGAALCEETWEGWQLPPVSMAAPIRLSGV